jgi:aspartate oxidase
VLRRSQGQVVATPPATGTAPLTLEELQRVMTAGAGVLRDAASLADVLSVLPPDCDASDPAGYELRNLLVVGRLLAGAALAREESRGTHTRLDFPERSNDFLGRFFAVADGSEVFEPLPVEVRQPSA